MICHSLFLVNELHKLEYQQDIKMQDIGKREHIKALLTSEIKIIHFLVFSNFSQGADTDGSQCH